MKAVYSSCLAALRQKMSEQGIDLVALGPSSHMMWLTGVDPHGDERPVMVLVSATGAAFLMPELNAEAARLKTDIPFFLWSDGTGPDAPLEEALSGLIERRPGMSVVIDETMRSDFTYLLTGHLDQPRVSFTQSTVGALRASKDESELTALRESARINDLAVMAGFDALREGVSEVEIVDVIFTEMKKHGAKPGFAVVAFGPNAAMPHHHSGERTLTADTAVLIDAGCWWENYPSDMTRMGFFGTPDSTFLAAFESVENAVQAAMAAYRPGITGREMDEAARGSLAAAGHGAAFVHRLGHSMGLDIHEPPYLNASSDDKLSDHSVFSIEPGVYYPGKFGIRLEDIVHADGHDLEILSTLGRDLILRA